MLLLFGFYDYYPRGGMDDLIDKFESYEDIENYFKTEIYFKYDNYQVYDTITGSSMNYNVNTCEFSDHN